MMRQLTAVAALMCLCSQAQADIIEVTQFNLVFSPQDVVIDVGDTVRWLHTGGTHDVVEGTDATIDGTEAFNGPLDGFNPTFEVVFDAAFLAAHPRPGNRYDYVCTPHINFGMVGTVTVRDVVEIQQAGMSFVPNDVIVELGQTVRWVYSGGSHTVTEGTDGALNGDEAFHSILTSSTSTFEVTFDGALLSAHPRPGNRYDYFCLPHFGMGMVGAVTVALPEPGSAYCFGDGSGTACPCGNAGGAGEGCANDTGNGALLSASGSASVASDDLVLRATNLTPGPGLFFQGDNAVNSGNGNPFGDGLRCAGGNVVRLEVQFANSNNSFTTESTISVATKGGVSAGDTKRYQFWYRDSGSSPCNSLFNLTNGYELSWGA